MPRLRDGVVQWVVNATICYRGRTRSSVGFSSELGALEVQDFAFRAVGLCHLSMMNLFRDRCKGSRDQPTLPVDFKGWVVEGCDCKEHGHGVYHTLLMSTRLRQ